MQGAGRGLVSLGGQARGLPTGWKGRQAYGGGLGDVEVVPVFRKVRGHRSGLGEQKGGMQKEMLCRCLARDVH